MLKEILTCNVDGQEGLKNFEIVISLDRLVNQHRRETQEKFRQPDPMIIPAIRNDEATSNRARLGRALEMKIRKTARILNRQIQRAYTACAGPQSAVWREDYHQ